MYVIVLRIALVVLITMSLGACSVDTSENVLDLDSLEKHRLTVGVTKTQEETVTHGESQINSVHLFLFQSDTGKKESESLFDQEGGMTSHSMKSTIGTKNLFAIVNYPHNDLSQCDDQQQLQALTVNLESQHKDDLTMVGEKAVEVKGGINETSIHVTRLVAKIILKRVTVDKPYNNGHIKVKRAFMKQVNAESKLRGSAYSPEVSNPVWQGYAEHDANYLAQLTEDIKLTGNDKEDLCHFYVFQNTDETSSTVLFIEAEYKQLQGNKTRLVYYPIVIKTGGRVGVQRNNIYTLSATIKRPGTPVPEITDKTGDLEVNVDVDDWEIGDEAELEFE